MASVSNTEEQLVEQMTKLTKYYTEKTQMIDSLRQEFNAKKPMFDTMVMSIKTLSDQVVTLKEHALALETQHSNAQEEVTELKKSVKNTNNLYESSFQHEYSDFFVSVQNIGDNCRQLEECIENGRMLEYHRQHKNKKRT